MYLRCFYTFHLKFLSYMTILLTIYSLATEGNKKVIGPGESSCNIIATYCNSEPIPTDEYPDSCTSFIFSSLTILEDLTLSYTYGEEANNEYFDTLQRSGKKLFVNIGPDNYTMWSKILDCDAKNAMDSANEINSYISIQSGITGLMFRAMEPAVTDTMEIVGYSQKVLKYIKTMKEITGFEIGLSFHADDFQSVIDEPKMSWLNFTVIDSCVDFYVFSLFTFSNECSGKNTGPIVIKGKEKYTLEKLKCAIDKSLIPQTKIHYNLALVPKDLDLSVCKASYQRMCKRPDKAKKWCSDTQETLFKKGQWFRKNGVGFIGAHIDYDDPQNVCECGKYSAFNAILAGFNGTASVPACPLFDRTG